ncbi:acyl carrier protein [Kribbella sp. NPDC051718]|uniref:acyl carrier protein n=1 Tax=Kribbella sp. NPDC051718 TaxID=3155168 RepID=UPI0034155D42
MPEPARVWPPQWNPSVSDVFSSIDADIAGLAKGWSGMAVEVTTESIRHDLREELARILYCDVDEISDDDSFVELGLDSVLGLEFLVVLNSRLSLTENIDVVYDHPTLARLTDHVWGVLSARAIDA